ncbi:NAD(P)H-binding protein [Dermacoccus sp. Tok2021]|uniref:SDR family oxidoreductase n=1 Tax=Dermacoccus sp. Tok2021 TaxID=2826873 RepID=UPI001CA62934|nr:NAD(P)H-binding protein [Dermacoccus sp. Tok2021]
MTTTPTAAPILPPDVLGVGRAPVLVTGASGVLGRAVVEELRASSIPVRALVHRTPITDVTCAVGDILTGAGLDEALPGVGAVIHCATDPSNARVDRDGTRNLLRSLDAWAPGAHLVLPSIVGCWNNPLAYYRTKADTENLAESWSGRASIVRATQFHTLAHEVVSGAAARLTGAESRVRVSPVDPEWVARKLVDVALIRTSLATPLELAGPETFSLGELSTLTAHLESRRPVRSVQVPTLGGVLRSFARGTNLPGEQAKRGGRTYAQWLAAR